MPCDLAVQTGHRHAIADDLRGRNIRDDGHAIQQHVWPSAALLLLVAQQPRSRHTSIRMRMLRMRNLAGPPGTGTSAGEPLISHKVTFMGRTAF